MQSVQLLVCGKAHGAKWNLTATACRCKVSTATLGSQPRLALHLRALTSAGPHTLELWNARDIRWREHHAYVMKAFTSPPTHHGIFAQVVMRTPAVHVSMPYRVHEIFKILSDTGHKCWYDPARKIWVMTGDSATDVLKWIVQVVCQRDLSDYKTAWRTAESAVEIESQWKFSNQSFVKAVVISVCTALTGSWMTRAPGISSTSRAWS